MAQYGSKCNKKKTDSDKTYWSRIQKKHCGPYIRSLNDPVNRNNVTIKLIDVELVLLFLKNEVSLEFICYVFVKTWSMFFIMIESQIKFFINLKSTCWVRVALFRGFFVQIDCHFIGNSWLCEFNLNSFFFNWISFVHSMKLNWLEINSMKCYETINLI